MRLIQVMPVPDYVEQLFFPAVAVAAQAGRLWAGNFALQHSDGVFQEGTVVALPFGLRCITFCSFPWISSSPMMCSSSPVEVLVEAVAVVGEGQPQEVGGERDLKGG